ncbi:MAG: glycine zipper family protein [Leptolyngbyaceae cyanobacterium SM1_1_3]|nr:glycine zipper family protein [Leptolyngbyaceae cyanobacterium SM1_1_3]NJN02818.1 glycine zipper family protein [Leptolyngbyaceae cyanobacterium RM1_1_2]NJO10534.1 glycine zipper family protein [Leptolyngbyaceae cyanobacterium SL_1_1]
MEDRRDIKDNPDANPDPLTGEPGAHPVGTGVGAAGAGVVGTAFGAIVGGPVGAAVGAVVGSVAGGLLGKGVAEQIDPTLEDNHWRDNYRSRPYVESDYDYDRDYSHAYRTGYEGYPNYASQNMTYADAEPRLREDYEKRRGSSQLSWDKAKHATQDAWNRVENSVRGRREQDDFWRNNYQSRHYTDTGYDYNDYAPAYRMGYDSYSAFGLNQGMSYEQAEPQIRSEYERNYGNSRLGWDKAKYAVQDAWNRVKEALPGNDRSSQTYRTR